MRVSVPAPLASLLRFWQRTLAAKGMLIRVVPLGTVGDQKGIMVLVHGVDRGSKRMRRLFEEDDDGGDMVINEQQGDQASFKDILTLSNKHLRELCSTAQHKGAMDGREGVAPELMKKMESRVMMRHLDLG
ncbi:hypothetical protein PVK06_044513 [Gossypium arboreum]|uniref:Uncharacterized protein n=1 Tax=Gossypium arboreum TaxID=29729 RepID=A0ABR0MRX9_GOSAR|nr:hypothetical protein PVK06_044513 [Gossypium arboreum]